jgi:hypothetical protein
LLDDDELIDFIEDGRELAIFLRRIPDVDDARFRQICVGRVRFVPV